MDYEVLSEAAPYWRRGDDQERARSRGNRLGDPEERALRRRRREAMVINEGDRPVSQQDVYMRDDEGIMSAEAPRE